MGKRVSLDPVRFIVTVNMAAAIRVVVHIRKYSMFLYTRLRGNKSLFMLSLNRA